MQNHNPKKTSKRRSAFAGAMGLMAAAAVIVGASWTVGTSARSLLLTQQEEMDPIIAGGDLDDLPALMRGNVPNVMSSNYYDQPRRTKTPLAIARVCRAFFSRASRYPANARA